MRNGRDLPFCPADQPTFFPTALPSFTPFPTATPLPTVTPFPSVTPFPTTDAEGGPTAPGTPSAPVTPPTTATLAPSNPGDTIAPTTAGGGGAPVVTPGGTVRVLVESILEYGFFPEVTLREPTEEEYNGLMVETTNFYTQALRAAFPNLQSFEAVRVADEFRPTNTDRPVQVDFDAISTFTEGTTIPTAAEVFEVMEDLDYMSKSVSTCNQNLAQFALAQKTFFLHADYITSFVWTAQPTDGIFSDTQRAAYAARVIA